MGKRQQGIGYGGQGRGNKESHRIARVARMGDSAQIAATVLSVPGSLYPVTHFLLTSGRASRSLLASRILEAEVRRYVRMLLAIHFDIWVNEVVQRVSGLLWRQSNISPNGELNTVFIPVSEEEFALFRMLPRFRDVNRHPSVIFRIEIGPAVIAGDVARMLVRWQGEADLESGRNLLRTRH